MLGKIVVLVVRFLLSLRYRVKITGLDKILEKGNKGILFLPNHPALIDPVILTSNIVCKLRPYILVTDEQVRGTILKHYVKELRLLPIPDLGITGQAGFERVEKTFEKCKDVLNDGGNVLMYPGGHIYHSRYETLRGNEGAHYLASNCKNARIVMVRTKGLWGSSFGRSCGYQRPFPEIFSENLKYVFKNLIFFCPRRDVEITFQEADDVPRTGTKEEVNRYLESFYNADAPGNTYVPYTFWEKGGVRVMPEPPSEDAYVNTDGVPDEIRKKVYARLREVASVTEIDDQDKLGADLGMDSLMIYGVLIWVQQEFGRTVNNPSTLKKVADVLLAANGQTVSVEQLRPVPPSWFIPPDKDFLVIPKNCPKITDTYLTLAKSRPDFPLLADQNTGVLTNRKIILAIMALKDVISEVPGERVGIVMPACAPFFVVFMAMLFAGKIPVVLNWTVGPRNLASCVKRSGISHILSSRLVIDGLEGRGTDFSAVKDKIVYLEDLKKKITLGKKLSAVFASRFCWKSLYKAKVPETMAILFTSGSETEPKVVPLVHESSLYDIEYSMTPMKLTKDDCILGMLPPFHSFGLMINIIMPAIANMRIVYHANPMEGNLLAKIISAYQATMIVGTPTFAAGILSNATQEQVKSIHIIITGAERCPQRTLDLIRKKCPQAHFLEGYGITECGPIVALNQPDATRRDTIGHILACVDYVILNPETGRKVSCNETGMLYVSGPTIFRGYLEYDGPSPFVEIDGKTWYKTGDLVKEDEEGYVTFMGRMKRFVKVAGEMVSLPAIEEALLAKFEGKFKSLPLAVEAAHADTEPEIVLFATFDIDKNEANKMIREAGFSPIHYVKRVVKLDEIPLLGSGKTNYRELKTLL